MVKTHNGTKYKFFWNGVFSNWYPSEFTIDGITYNCGEQYMMYQKALTFGDTETAKKILAEPSPRIQKQYGREVKNYDDKKWCDIRYKCVKFGLAEKFTQNPSLLSYLREFKDHVIVEASPYDRIWGIGFLEDDAIDNFEKWGENLLGKILTELSKEI